MGLCGGTSGSEAACGVVGVEVCGGEAFAGFACAEEDDTVACAVVVATVVPRSEIGVDAAWA